jgi:hypothetical protein
MTRTAVRRALLLVLLAAASVLGACRADAPATLPPGVADADSPADLVALLAELLPRVERLSGLDRTDVLRMRRQSRVDAAAYVERRLDSELPPDRLDAIRRTYAALGLVPDTLDLRTLLLELYTEQVLGYYDPATTTLFVLEGEDAAGLRPLLAHELVHALQDQHTNLDSLVSYERGNDRQTAAHAALEGHAMVVMFAVLAEEATRRRIDPVTLPDPSVDLGDALAAQNQQFPVFGRAPAVIQETLLFPYVHGASFVHRLWSSMAPLERYPAPIDTLLPQSTAAVLAPQPLERLQEPVELSFADVPHGWRTVHENTLGKLETAIFLGEHLGTAARAAADGWRGDRYLLLTDETGADVLHWVSVWESTAAAERFARAVLQAVHVLTGSAGSATLESLDRHAAVRVVLGSGAAAWQAAGPGVVVARPPTQ